MRMAVYTRTGSGDPARLAAGRRGAALARRRAVGRWPASGRTSHLERSGSLWTPWRSAGWRATGAANAVGVTDAAHLSQAPSPLAAAIAEAKAAGLTVAPAGVGGGGGALPKHPWRPR